MSMTKHSPPVVVVTAVMTLLVAAVTPLWASETDAEGPVGVEKYDAPCTPGDGEPITITTVNPGTSRVEITWLGCECFDSEEAAATWLGEVGQLAIEGKLIGLEAAPREYTMVAEPEPGQEVPLVAYCLTAEEIGDYLKLLEPREVDLRDGS